MIQSFRHNGLERFFLTGSRAGIQLRHASRLRLILARLHASTGFCRKVRFWGKIQKSGVRNSMAYRCQHSRKSNFATEPVQVLLDAHCPTHGNGVGLRLGWVSVVWGTHILSEGDHRLNHVAPWAKQRLYMLKACTGQPVYPLDVSDDRLATVLEALRDDMHGRAGEGALNQHARRVSALQPACVRLDRTTASGYGTVTEDGLFQCGHRQDHRPDLPQVKVMLSALDPLGLPVATDVVPGQRADDPLDIPAITRVWESLGRRGLLYRGDCQMGALETRACIQAGGDDYLCPLSEIQLPPAVLGGDLAPVWRGEHALTLLHRPQPGGPSALIAEGFERREPVTAEVAGKPYSWRERRLVSRSCQRAQAGERGRRARLANAQAAVTALHTCG